MKHYQVSCSGTVPAPPARVYGIIADYGRHHPHIVPPEYFRRLEVLAGGVGAGTRTRVEMRVLGKVRIFEQIITEPEPGRVLQETEPDGTSLTTFTVDADEAGAASRVTITTQLVARPGIAGALERLMTSMMLGRIYRKEISRLGEYASGLSASPSPGQTKPGKN